MFKKRILPILAVLAVLAVGIYFAVKNNLIPTGKEQSVYVSKVSEINGADGFIADRYAGVVKPQSTVDVKKDADKEIAEVMVEEGQQVKKGDSLFRYDISGIETSIETGELEIEGMDNEILSLKAEVEELKEQRSEADDNEVLNYTTEIQAREMQIRQTEFDKQTKQKEIDKLKKTLENDIVTSPIDGTIKKINDKQNDYESGDVFMSITQTGDIRVQGKLDENSVLLLTTGQKVIVRSRLDENQTWSGTITSIETEPVEESNDMMYPSYETEKATMYPFYVSLESTKGLMLGQHVFIEPDFGESEIKEGIWLDAGYIVKEDDKAYVWAANDKGRIEKREVTLGKTDDATGEYQITDGLSVMDSVAWNDGTVKEGSKVIDPTAEDTSVEAESAAEEQSAEMPVEEMPSDGEASPADGSPE